MSEQWKQEARGHLHFQGVVSLGAGEGGPKLGIRALYSLLSPSLFTMELLPRAW